MKTVLVFPPAADPAHPPLGIAALAGYLRQRGHEVELLDANISSLHHLLSRENLARCTRRLEERLCQLEREQSLAPADQEEYTLALEHVLGAEFVHRRVEEALRRLKEPDTYASAGAYRAEASVVRKAMELVSAAHYPVRWYPRGFSMEHLPTASQGVLAALDDERQNLFLPVLREHAARIAAGRPAVVGLSLNYYCQLIPGLTLARLLKECLPGVFVVAGGGLVCFLDQKWEALAAFDGLVDAWIPYEGERPLDALLSALGRSGDPEGAPGVLHFAAGHPEFRSPPPPPAPSELPAPDYRGLPLESYLAPAPVLSLLSSRGCYWGRCGFCSHDRLYRESFRRRSGGSVVAEMEEQHRRHGARVFYLVDEAIPPRTAREIAAEIARRGLPFTWFGEMRMEAGLDPETLAELRRGGCRMLMFGLESASPRVLDNMDKGITVERAVSVLRACHQSGVKSFVMFMLGFPTETEAEAQRTIEFVEEHARYTEGVAFTNFILVQHSPVHREPGRYGVVEVSEYEQEDLKIYSRYRVAEGLSAAEAVRLAEEAREREVLGALIDPDLLSRSHLAVLPRREEPAVREVSTEVDAPSDVLLGRYPLRAPDLVARASVFDLDQIRERRRAARNGKTATPVARGDASYVYRPSLEKLVEVGPDGIDLLRRCDGRSTLEDILDGFRDESREAALRFYGEMVRNRMIRWETTT